MIGTTRCKEILYNLKLIDESNEIMTSEAQKLKLLIDNCIWISKRRDSQITTKKVPFGRKESSSNMNSMQGMFRLGTDDLSSPTFGLNPDQFGNMHVQYSNYEQFVESNSGISAKRMKNIAAEIGTGTGTGTTSGINDENTVEGFDFSNSYDGNYGNNEKKVKFDKFIFMNLCVFPNTIFNILLLILILLCF